MSINDEYIKNEFRNSRGMTNHYRLKRATKEELDYLNNRYDDSESINETLIRIYYNYNIHPKCPICGKPLELFRTKWRKYCSQSCKSKDLANQLEQKYGVRSTLQLEENKEKSKQTCIKHYGVDHPLKSKQIRNQIKQTNKEKYGYEFISQSEECKNKVKQTCLERYGSEYYFTSQDCKQKTIEKFGVDNYRKTDKCKQLVSQYCKEHKEELLEKRKQTCLERYGVDNPLKVKKIRERIKQTCLKKYGALLYVQSKEYKQWISEHPEIIKEWNIKSYNTKKKNGTLGGPHSIQEDQSYELLKEKYPDVIRQYRSELYPFNCDFYIPSLNLYIECQYYPTHGYHPFNPNDKNDIKYIEYLSNTKFGSYIWTINDPFKRNIAKQNNLNYLEFFNINELKKWLNKNG